MATKKFWNVGPWTQLKQEFLEIKVTSLPILLFFFFLLLKIWMETTLFRLDNNIYKIFFYAKNFLKNYLKNTNRTEKLIKIDEKL